MEKLTIDLPLLFADHHVTAVRQILFSIPGITDVYASSAFQVVEVTFDALQTGEAEIRRALESAGYMGRMPLEIENSSGVVDSRSRRLTEYDASSQGIRFTRRSPSAEENLPSEARAQWPIPGLPDRQNPNTDKSL